MPILDFCSYSASFKSTRYAKPLCVPCLVFSRAWSLVSCNGEGLTSGVRRGRGPFQSSLHSDYLLFFMLLYASVQADSSLKGWFLTFLVLMSSALPQSETALCRSSKKFTSKVQTADRLGPLTWCPCPPPPTWVPLKYFCMCMGQL